MSTARLKEVAMDNWNLLNRALEASRREATEHQLRLSGVANLTEEDKHTMERLKNCFFNDDNRTSTWSTQFTPPTGSERTVPWIEWTVDDERT